MECVCVVGTVDMLVDMLLFHMQLAQQAVHDCVNYKCQT